MIGGTKPSDIARLWQFSRQLPGRFLFWAGPFSIIHGLSVLTLAGLWQRLVAVRSGDIARHQAEMRNLYFWAMGVAGLFTFLLGRRMNRVFFADMPVVGFAVAAAIIGAGLAWYWARYRRFTA